MSEVVYEITLGLHKVGLVSDEELRQCDLVCRPRRPRWVALLAFELSLWGIWARRFFYWDHLWQRRVECYLKKRLGGLWQGQPDSPETLGRE